MEAGLDLSRPAFSGLDFRDIYRLGTLRAFFNIKANFVTFSKGLKTTAFDGRVVDKNISTVFSSNESETFTLVKPFDFAIHDATNTSLLKNLKITEL
jgi:hypothetical protein